MRGVKGEKVKRREEEEEWKILGCGLRDFVVVGKVVPLLADCYSILFLFLLLIFIFHISYFIFTHVLNPSPPSLPPSLSNSSFLTPFSRHPIT